MKDTLTSIGGGSLLGILGGIKWVSGFGLAQILQPDPFNQEWMLKLMSTLMLGVVGGFGGLVGKAMYTMIKKFINHNFKTISQMERGSLVPLIMAAIMAAALLICNMHGANVIAYEYAKAGRFFNVMAWVCFALAAAAPIFGRAISGKVKSDRGLTWIGIAIVAVLLILGMFAVIGFDGTYGNPYL